MNRAKFLSSNQFMRYLLILLFLIFAAVPCYAEKSGNVESAGPGVTVLIYHRFGEDKYPSTNIGVERFREQLEYLKTNDYKVISLEQLVHYLSEGTELPEKSVVITIDDGYRSVYDNAWPLLRTYGYPFTVFLYAKATENKHWNYLTWDQVKEMAAGGVDFQNHGFSHNHMAFKPSGMNMNEYMSLTFRAWEESSVSGDETPQCTD